jgi:hypothetical protein
MRSACLIGLIAGCGFTSSPAVEDPVGEPGGSGGAGGTASQCDVNDPSLRLCLTFQTPMVQDLALPPHPLADTIGIQILADATAKLDGRSHIRFVESADFDVSELTFDLWIDPGKMTKNQGSATILARGQSYDAAYQEDGHVQCGIADQRVVSATAIMNNWHHVACRYDTTAHELRVYIDGDVSGCAPVPGGIPTPGSNGLAIGASYGADGMYQNSYVGGLDGLHLYARARSDAELCTAARRTSCNTQCPDQGGDGRGGRGAGR